MDERGSARWHEAPEPVVARKLNGERLVVLSWSRAILLQMAHPLIAAGVAEHSTFRGGAAAAARRAHGTIGAMLSLTFGDDGERESTVRRIRDIHSRVNGTLRSRVGPYPEGTRYSAEDPELVLWVHATLLETIPDFYQRVVGRLSNDELDAFCRESAPTAVALGAEPDRVPRSWRELRDYVDAVHRDGVLAVGEDAMMIARAVLNPRMAGVRLPGTSIHQLITIGLLPSAIREAYGYAWTADQERRLGRSLRALRTARRFMPDFVALWRAARRGRKRR